MMAGLKTRSERGDKFERRESARARARGRGSERERLYNRLTNMIYLLSIMDT
jgi:hypothetical protein